MKTSVTPGTAPQAALSEDREYTMEELLEEFADPPLEPKPVRTLGLERAVRTDDFNIKAELAARARLATSNYDASFFKLLEESCHTGSAPATRTENLRGNAESWEARLRIIDGAKSFIVLSNYTIGADKYGLEMMDHLIEAAKRGVKILGTQTWAASEIANRFVLGNADNYELFQRKLADLEAYGCFFTYHATIGKALTEGFHGNHFKSLCADGEVALVGGRNVVGFHFDPKVSMGDFEMVLEGPIALNIARETARVIGAVPLAGNKYTVVQDRDRAVEIAKSEVDKCMWRAAETMGAKMGQMKPQIREALPVMYPIVWDPVYDAKKVVDTENRASRAMLETIRRAKKEVIITQNYINPPDVFMEALCDAAQRGVKVTLVTTGEKDSGLSNWPYITATTYYKGLLMAGAHIVETNGLPEHEKVLIADNQIGAFGSYNIEHAAHSSLVEGMFFTTSPDMILFYRAAAMDAIMCGKRIDQEELDRMNVPGKFRLFDRFMAKVTKKIL